MRSLCCTLALLLLTAGLALAQAPRPVILDADTGNEIDDLYALARALVEPSWEVLALNAAQWQASHWAVPETMENSHRLNQVMVGYTGVDVPTLRGGATRMYDWGDQAQHSAAAYEIIRRARALPEGDSLTVVVLGALTNVASAVYIDPSVASKLAVYWLGSTYDFDTGVMGTTDFNCVMDIQALHVMLRSEAAFHVIPTNVAEALTLSYAETEAALRDAFPLGDFLVDRWYQHLDGLRTERVVWDLALIQAMIHPTWAEQVTITTSKDYGARPIHYYRAIDAAQMRTEFYTALDAFFNP